MGKIIIEASSMSELAALVAQLMNTTSGTVAHIQQTVGVPASVMAGNAAPSDDTDGDDEGPANTSAPDTDKNGIRWDARIHASTKALNADGTWRMMRGIEKKIGAEAVAAIEAELKGAAPQQPAAPQMPQPGPAPVAPPMPMPDTSAAPVMPAPVPTPPAPGMPSEPVQVPQNAVFAQPNIPPQALEAPAPAPVPQPPAPVAPAAGGMPFNEFMPLLGRMMQPHPANNHTYVDAGYLASLCQYLGVENITQIAATPEKIGMAVDKLKADQRWWTA